MSLSKNKGPRITHQPHPAPGVKVNSPYTAGYASEAEPPGPFWRKQQVNLVTLVIAAVCPLGMVWRALGRPPQFCCNWSPGSYAQHPGLPTLCRTPVLLGWSPSRKGKDPSHSAGLFRCHSQRLSPVILGAGGVCTFC